MIRWCIRPEFNEGHQIQIAKTTAFHLKKPMSKTLSRDRDRFFLRVKKADIFDTLFWWFIENWHFCIETLFFCCFRASKVGFWSLLYVDIVCILGVVFWSLLYVYIVFWWLAYIILPTTRSCIRIEVVLQCTPNLAVSTPL